jgi:hypothetical protein
MWKLNDTVASFESSHLCCILDVAKPSDGMRHLRVASVGVTDAALWQVELPLRRSELADCYVRGNDLVATYHETEQRSYRIQLYWRFVAEDDCFGFEFIPSVQTSKLACAPGFSIITVWNSPPLLQRDTVHVFPITTTDWSFVEMAHPSNLDATSDDAARIAYALFPGQLEKGVIRRARIRGLFLPTPNVQETAVRLHQQFVESAPPLTT